MWLKVNSLLFKKEMLNAVVMYVSLS